MILFLAFLHENVLYFLYSFSYEKENFELFTKRLIEKNRANR